MWSLWLLLSNGGGSCRSISRKGNRVAHSLAHFAFFAFGRKKLPIVVFYFPKKKTSELLIKEKKKKNNLRIEALQ